MRIIGEKPGALLVDEQDGFTGRVFDTSTRVLGPQQRMDDLVGDGWLAYRGPQNLAHRLADATVKDLPPATQRAFDDARADRLASLTAESA